MTEGTGNDVLGWGALAKQLDTRQLRNALKQAYRREARKALAVARGKLRSSGLHVQGSRPDWEQGVRSRIYPRGGGFMVTVKGRASGRGGKEASMHANRFYVRTGRRLPILQWAEEGTAERRTRPSRRARAKGAKASPRGRMPAYRFMERATPQMFRSVEGGLAGEVEAAVRRVAAKAGFS